MSDRLKSNQPTPRSSPSPSSPSPSPNKSQTAVSSIQNLSPASTARAHGWFRQLEEEWKKKDSSIPTVTTNEASNRSEVRNRELLQILDNIIRQERSIHEGVLHGHAQRVVEMTREAIDLWKKQRHESSTTITRPTSQTFHPTPTTVPKFETVAPAAINTAATNAATSQEATQSIPSSDSPTSTSTSNPPVATPESATIPASTSAPLPHPPFHLFPSTLHALLRLLIIMCQRLPKFYSQAWSASMEESSSSSSSASKKSTPIPLPKGLEYSVYQAWFNEIRSIGRAVTEECIQGLDSPSPSSSAPSQANGTPRHQPWDARLCMNGYHLSVLALCHCPGMNESDRVELDYLEHLLDLPDHWLAIQLPHHPLLTDLLTCIVTILHSRGDLKHLISMTVKIHRCYRFYDDRLLKMSAAVEHNGAASPNKPHDARFMIHATPPGLTQHQPLRNFLTLALDSAFTLAKKSASQDHDTDPHKDDSEHSSNAEDDQLHIESLHELEEFIVTLIRDAAEHFDMSTKSLTHASTHPPVSSSPSSPSPLHRSIFPLFSLTGIMDTLEAHKPVAEHTDMITLMQGTIRRQLARMIQTLIEIPELRSFIEDHSDTTSHLPAPPSALSPITTSAPHWPCDRYFNSCCGSCLFVLLASAAFVHSAKWIDEVYNETTDDAHHVASDLVRSMTIVIGKVFLHLVDLTWALNGSITIRHNDESNTRDAGSHEASTILSSSSTAPSTLQPSSTPTPSSPTSSSSFRSPSRSRDSRLLAWLTSPFALLLPHYTMSLSICFLKLHDVPVETQFMVRVWKSVRYMHEVWRWYERYGDDEPVKSATKSSDRTILGTAKMTVTKPDITTPSSTSTSSSGVTASQSTASVHSPATSIIATTSADDTSPSSSIFVLSPLRFSRSILNRAHRTLFMSLTMFVSTVIRSDEFRRRHQTNPLIYAVLIDLLSDVEYFGIDVIESFKPYKELNEIIQAILNGREVVTVGKPPKDENTKPSSASSITQSQSAASSKKSSPSSATAALSPLYQRVTLARDILCLYIRCFLRRDHAPIDKYCGFESLSKDAALTHLASVSRPQYVSTTSLPFLLALSGFYFSPPLERRIDDTATQIMITVTNATSWEEVEKEIHFKPPATDDHPASTDLIGDAKDAYLSLIFSTTLASIPLPIVFHVLLPWAAKRSGCKNKNLSPRAQHLLVVSIQKLFKAATGPTKVVNGKPAAAIDSTDMEDVMAHVLTEATPSIRHLPGLPSPIHLERFLRQTIPFLIQRALNTYPHDGTNFHSLLDTSLTLFGCLPPSDALIVVLLERMLLGRAKQLLDQLIANENRLKRWRQVTELSQIDLEEEEEDERRESQHEDKKSSTTPSPSQLLTLPKNVRLPPKFPSLTSIRRLLLLHLQLMQMLDSSLYPSALRQVDSFLTSLNPYTAPIVTPIRASLITSIHSALVRGFDLTKRDATAEWFIQLVQQLNIPITMKLKFVAPPPPTKASLNLSPEAMKGLEALRRAAETGSPPQSTSSTSAPSSAAPPPSSSATGSTTRR